MNYSTYVWSALIPSPNIFLHILTPTTTYGYNEGNGFVDSLLLKPKHIPTSENPNRCYKISCKSLNHDQESPSPSKFDRRNLLIRRHHILATSPFAFAAPIPAPDVTQCGPADLPEGATPTNCCPPLTDFPFPPPTVIDLNYSGVDPDTTDQQMQRNLTVMYRQMVSNEKAPRLFFCSPYRRGEDPNPGGGSIEGIPHGLIHLWAGDRTQPNARGKHGQFLLRGS